MPSDTAICKSMCEFSFVFFSLQAWIFFFFSVSICPARSWNWCVLGCPFQNQLTCFVVNSISFTFTQKKWSLTVIRVLKYIPSSSEAHGACTNLVQCVMHCSELFKYCMECVLIYFVSESFDAYYIEVFLYIYKPCAIYMLEILRFSCFSIVVLLVAKCSETHRATLLPWTGPRSFLRILI